MACVNRMDAAKVDSWLDRLGRVLLPARCLVCGEGGADGRDLCPSCAAALPWNRTACPRCAIPLPMAATACGRCLKKAPPFEAVHATFAYGFALDRLLPRLKFQGDLAAGRLLATLMQVSLPDVERPAALVPVPLSCARLRERGYDQALELAKPLARALHLPLRGDLLRRPRHTAAQSDLDALARRRNVRGAFVVPAAAMRGRAALPAHVALIDDVMTTGATLAECAKALKRAGVARVDAWVVARVPNRAAVSV